MWDIKEIWYWPFTLQMTNVNNYHYEIMFICRKILYLLFYSFIRFQREKAGENVFFVLILLTFYSPFNIAHIPLLPDTTCGFIFMI